MMKALTSAFRFLILVMVLSASGYAQTGSPKGDHSEILSGVWQDGPAVGSGLSNNFQFFKNGTYRFNYNEMDGTKRIISHSGEWKAGPKKITITVKKIKLLIGGKWVKSSGSIATEFEIEGGKIFEKSIYPFETLDLSLGSFQKEELHVTAKIGGIKYWKLSSDPNTYTND